LLKLPIDYFFNLLPSPLSFCRCICNRICCPELPKLLKIFWFASVAAAHCHLQAAVAASSIADTRLCRSVIAAPVDWRHTLLKLPIDYFFDELPSPLSFRGRICHHCWSFHLLPYIAQAADWRYFDLPIMLLQPLATTKLVSPPLPLPILAFAAYLIADTRYCGLTPYIAQAADWLFFLICFRRRYPFAILSTPHLPLLILLLNALNCPSCWLTIFWFASAAAALCLRQAAVTASSTADTCLCRSVIAEPVDW
jgi:hypothetical protein